MSIAINKNHVWGGSERASFEAYSGIVEKVVVDRGPEKRALWTDPCE